MSLLRCAEFCLGEPIKPTEMEFISGRVTGIFPNLTVVFQLFLAICFSVHYLYILCISFTFAVVSGQLVNQHGNSERARLKLWHEHRW